jgi:hypothetical protein
MREILDIVAFEEPKDDRDVVEITRQGRTVGDNLHPANLASEEAYMNRMQKFGGGKEQVTAAAAAAERRKQRRPARAACFSWGVGGIRWTGGGGGGGGGSV